MKQRIITALVLILVCLPPLYFGGVSLRILIFSVAALASYEMVSITGDPKKPNWGMILFLFASIVVQYNVPEDYFPMASAFLVIVLFTIVILDARQKLADVAYIYITSSIITLALEGIVRIYDHYGGMVMIFVAFACFGCDTGAYFFGIAMGRHKMCPRISPKKTWEGSIGGYVSGALLSLFFGLLYVKVLPQSLIITASLTLPVIAQIGDLSFSLIKRYYGVKDFGSIFPGHGGLLDRIDSLLFCLMFFNGLLLLWGTPAVLIGAAA
jgi:phosphatidate cytidylyltransferase